MAVEKQEQFIDRRSRTRGLIKILLVLMTFHIVLSVVLWASIFEPPSMCTEPQFINGIGKAYGAHPVNRDQAQIFADSGVVLEAQHLAENTYQQLQCSERCPQKRLSRIKTDVRRINARYETVNDDGEKGWQAEAYFHWYASMSCY